MACRLFKAVRDWASECSATQDGAAWLLHHVLLVGAATGCDCKKIYKGGPQVCGADLRTYGNECVAKCANVLISSTGQCPVCNIKTGSEDSPTCAPL